MPPGARGALDVALLADGALDPVGAGAPHAGLYWMGEDALREHDRGSAWFVVPCC